MDLHMDSYDDINVGRYHWKSRKGIICIVCVQPFVTKTSVAERSESKICNSTQDTFTHADAGSQWKIAFGRNTCSRKRKLSNLPYEGWNTLRHTVVPTLHLFNVQLNYCVGRTLIFTFKLDPIKIRLRTSIMDSQLKNQVIFQFIRRKRFYFFSSYVGCNLSTGSSLQLKLTVQLVFGDTI